MYFILFDAFQSPLHLIHESLWPPGRNMDARVKKSPKMMKMGSFPQKCHRKWQVPESPLRVLSSTLDFASTEIWFVEIGPAIRTGNVLLSWKISRFYFLAEIAWGNFKNIFQLSGPITPKPLDRMYPLRVPWNSIYSSMCRQKISLIARYLRPVMWWTTHTYVWEEQKQSEPSEKKSKNLALLRLAVEVEYLRNLYS